MDQSKWCLPRLRHGTLSKSMQKLDRPRVKIQGVWCHQVCLHLHMVDVRLPSDGSTVAESVIKTLEHVHTILQDKMPRKILMIAARQNWSCSMWDIVTELLLHFWSMNIYILLDWGGQYCSREQEPDDPQTVSVDAITEGIGTHWNIIPSRGAYSRKLG